MSFHKATVVSLTFLVLSFGSAMVARATPVTIVAADTGWYQEDGHHSFTNYIASTGGLAQNNYFTFSLSGVSGTITGATISIFNPVNGFFGSPGMYTLYDVVTPPSILIANNSAAVGITIYNDLGSGTVFGSTNVSSADNGTVITISLNAAAIAALNATNGGVFAIGGAFSAPSGSVVFGFTGFDARNQLALQVSDVPEPSTLVLFCTGLVGLASRLRKRKSNFQR